MATAKSLTPAEIQQVLDYIASSANAARNRCLFLMSVMAGLRVSELAGLTVGDIRRADGSIKAEVYLAAHRVKHAHARTVFLSTRLQTELANFIVQRNWLDDTQPLFSIHHSPRKAFSANTLTQHFFWQYKRAGTDVGVRVRAIVVEVQIEQAGFEAVVPIAKTDREHFQHTSPTVAVIDFNQPPIIRPISSFNFDQCSYFLKSR